MKPLNLHIYIILLVSTLLNGQARSEVQVQAQVDRSSPIYAGSPFSYHIVVANGDQPDQLDLTPLEQFHPSNPSTQSRTSIVNGRSASYQILTYQMTAPSEGEYTIPSVKLTVSGKEYKTNTVAISVVKPGATKQMDVEVTLSSEKCYVGQPVVLTLSLFIWTDIVRADKIANVDIQVPFLDQTQFYLEDVDSIPQDLAKTALPVNGQKEYVYQNQVMHNGVDCVQVQFFKVLIPRNPGSFQYDPASVTADIAISRKTGGRDPFFMRPQYEYKRFGVQSDPISLDVNALPQTGKPDDFYGLVGHFTISADAAPTQVNVGDPITLTIKIGGNQYLKPVQWPDLEKIPEMASSFKIPSEYADGQMKDGQKVFTQTIRANKDSVTQIPPVPLSYFDLKADQYRTIYTDPIPLDVSPTRIVTGMDVESQSHSPVSKQIKAIKEGISANYLSADALINQRFSIASALTSFTFIILWLCPAMILAGSLLTRQALTNSPKRQMLNKQKKACSEALKRIQQAQHHPEPAPQISIALKHYIADKFNKVAGSLTGQDCKEILFEKTKDLQLSQKFQDIIEQLEVSEYSPLSLQITPEKTKEISQFLTEIEKTIK